MTSRYRITMRAKAWVVDKFNPDTAEWVTLPGRYDNAEFAGRVVDSMVAMDQNAKAKEAV